jgi:integrase
MASIEQRANGWRVVWRQDHIKQAERFPTKTAAEKFAKIVEAHGNRWPHGWVKGHGFTVAPSTAPTFAEWAARAIASRATANPRTRHDYERDINRHLLPAFGTEPVDRITREQVGRWLIGMQGAVKAKTIKNVHNLASSIMSDAIDHGLTTANPFRGALKGLPAVKQEEMVFLTRGEFDTLLSYAHAHYRPLVLTLAYTGLRWSEATALRVSDVDLFARRLRVVRAWKRTPENLYEIGEPKSRRSRRSIVISRRLVDALIPLTAGRGGEELLFTTVQGRAVRDNNFRLRAWTAALTGMQRCPTHAASPEPCGCPGTVPKTPRIHDLRHSHASWLIADKVSLVAIQRRLGHESITTTIDRYGHLVPDVDLEVLAALEAWDASADIPVALDR